MVNRYAGTCEYCGCRVPANGGECQKLAGRWVVSHITCFKEGKSNVIVTRFNSGAEVYQNRKGRCEDAPCCGCCS